MALLAAWQIPGRLDWNRYRATIEALASATLGRSVTIAGPITLSLLPETELTAADVVVGGGAVTGAPSLTVKALRLRVALLPLLSGRVDARELALSGPEFSVDWPPQRGEFAAWPPYWLSAFSAKIENGRINVGGLALEGIAATLETTDTGGLIASGTGRLGGQRVRFTARLTASGSDGASGVNLVLEGQERYAGVTGAFAGQLTTEDGLSGQIDIAGPDLAKLFPIPVPAAAPGGAASPLPAPFLAGAAPAGAFKLGAAVRIAGDAARFDDLAFGVSGPGGATALDGTAVLGLAPRLRLDLQLATARLELDPWMVLLVRAGGAGLVVGLDLKAGAVAAGGGMMRGLTAAMEVTPAQVTLHRLAVELPGEARLSLAGIVQRGDPARPRFEGSVELAAPRLREALRWLDGAGIQLLPDLPAGVLTSADFRAHAAVEPGLLALNAIAGKLDGTTMSGELRLWPRLRPAGAGAQGSGPAMVASLEFSELRLDPWLAYPKPRSGDTGRGFDVDLRLRSPMAWLRGEAIRALSLDASVQSAAQGVSGPGTQAQNAQTAQAQSAQPHGAPAQGTPAQGTPAQSGQIQSSQVQGNQTLNAPASVAPLPGPAAPPVTATVVPSPTVAIAVAMAGIGKVTLRQLEATIRGVHLLASGTVADGGRLSEGKLRASTENASALADMVPPFWRPETGFWRGPAVLNMQLAGPTEALGARLSLDMADARLEAQPVIDLRSGIWSSSLTLRHPGATRLLGMLGLAGVEGWIGEGSLSAIAHVAGVPGGGGIGRVSADMLELTVGQLRVSAPLTLDLNGELPIVSGQVQADVLALPALSWRDGAPLPFALLRGWRGNVKLAARQVLVARLPVLSQLSATVNLADGTLRVGPLNATLAGGSLNATLTANAASDPPDLTATVTLTDATVPAPAPTDKPASQKFELLAGRVNASANLHATGYSPAAMLATLSGGTELNVTDGVLSGFDLFHVTRAVATADPHTRQTSEAALRAGLTEGVTSFDRLAIRAEAKDGTLLLQQGTLIGSAGTAGFSGSLALGAQGMDLRVELQPAVETPPEIAVRWTGPWEQPRRSPELSGFLRWLAERPLP